MSENRNLPPIDRHTIGPYADVSILKFYEGIFDTVYISLNPFAQILDSSNYSISDFWNKDSDESYKNRYLKHTKAVSWKEIIEITSLVNINEVDIALRTSIVGLSTEKQSLEFEIILQNAMDKFQIIPPSEGSFQENNINLILNAIKKLGYEWICIGSEFGDTMELVWIDDIINEIKKLICHSCLYTYDRKILITSHWDSFQTYICSNLKTVEKIVNYANLEGFYAENKTEIYWSVKDQ